MAKKTKQTMAECLQQEYNSCWYRVEGIKEVLAKAQNDLDRIENAYIAYTGTNPTTPPPNPPDPGQ